MTSLDFDDGYTRLDRREELVAYLVAAPDRVSGLTMDDLRLLQELVERGADALQVVNMAIIGYVGIVADNIRVVLLWFPDGMPDSPLLARGLDEDSPIVDPLLFVEALPEVMARPNGANASSQAEG